MISIYILQVIRILLPSHDKKNTPRGSCQGFRATNWVRNRVPEGGLWSDECRFGYEKVTFDGQLTRVLVRTVQVA